jgi:hypothetical protein
VAFLAFSFANFLGSFWDTPFYRPLLVLVDEVETLYEYTLPIMGWNGGKKSNHPFRVGRLPWEKNFVPPVVSGLGAGAKYK